MTQPALSIIIPAFNEAARLPRFLATALPWLDAHEPSFEVIVLDDGSHDDTSGAARATGHPALRVIRHRRNAGKGAAVRTGMLAARGELRLFADADGATELAELPALRAAIAGGAQIAIASREGGGKRVEVSLFRRTLGRTFNRVVRMGMLPGIRDTQCGFKLFAGPAAWGLFEKLHEPGYAFDVELLFLASQLGLSVAEVPVNWTAIPGSKVNVWADGLRMLRAVRRVKRRWREGGYTGPGPGMPPHDELGS